MFKILVIIGGALIALAGLGWLVMNRSEDEDEDENEDED